MEWRWDQSVSSVALCVTATTPFSVYVPQACARPALLWLGRPEQTRRRHAGGDAALPHLPPTPLPPLSTLTHKKHLYPLPHSPTSFPSLCPATPYLPVIGDDGGVLMVSGLWEGGSDEAILPSWQCQAFLPAMKSLKNGTDKTWNRQRRQARQAGKGVAWAFSG